MDRSKLEYLTRQAIERGIACFASFKPRESPTVQSVYSDEDYSEGYGYQVGFEFYYDWGAKRMRISASACIEEGFTGECIFPPGQELNLSQEFVSELIDIYIKLIKEARITMNEFVEKLSWWGEGMDCPKLHKEPPIPFECSVADEWYQALEIEREEMKQAVIRLVEHCKNNRDLYIRMHNFSWRRIVCVLTGGAGYIIGFRIRYDAQEGGGFCPICKNDGGEYWQKETCSYIHMPDDKMEFVENLTDYYVYLLAMQRGLIVWDNPSEKFTEKDVASIAGILGPERIVFI